MKKLLLLLFIPFLSFGQILCDGVTVALEDFNDSNIAVIISTENSPNFWCSYCGLTLVDSDGNIVAIENPWTAPSFYGLAGGYSELRTLDIIQNITFPFDGFLNAVNGLMPNVNVDEDFIIDTGNPIDMKDGDIPFTMCSWAFQLNSDEILGCTLSDGTFVNNGWSGNGTGDNWCNSCFCEDSLLSCTELDCGEEGCWEGNEWYCVGCEYVIDECSYIECESNNNWSEIIISDECGVCVVMNTIILDCFCDWPEAVIFWEEFDEETCTMYEMCDCQNITIEEEVLGANKSLIQTIDMLGRATTNNKGFNIEIYDDGSVEKKYLIK